MGARHNVNKPSIAGSRSGVGREGNPGKPPGLVEIKELCSRRREDEEGAGSWHTHTQRGREPYTASQHKRREPDPGAMAGAAGPGNHKPHRETEKLKKKPKEKRSCQRAEKKGYKKRIQEKEIYFSSGIFPIFWGYGLRFYAFLRKKDIQRHA